MQRDRKTTRTTGERDSWRRAGFTVVEMLTALTIGALLVMSAVSATRALTGARQKVDERTARVAEARRALDAIVAGLRNIRRDPPQQNVPLLIGHSGGRGAGNDSINFHVIDARRVRPDGAESDQQEMSFYLSRPTRQRPVPLLLCRRDHALDDHPEEGGIATVVAEHIVTLSFEYFSAGQWYPEWRSTEPRPPEAVRVTVAAALPQTPGERGRPEVTVLSAEVPIRVNLPDAPAQGPGEAGPAPPGGLPG